jgi:hypothetical protein
VAVPAFKPGIRVAIWSLQNTIHTSIGCLSAVTVVDSRTSQMRGGVNRINYVFKTFSELSARRRAKANLAEARSSVSFATFFVLIHLKNVWSTAG